MVAMNVMNVYNDCAFPVYICLQYGNSSIAFMIFTIQHCYLLQRYTGVYPDHIRGIVSALFIFI